MAEWFAKQQVIFVKCFLEKNRGMFLLNGLKNTLIITFFAVILGVLLGTLIAVVRTSHDNTIDRMVPGPKRFFLKFANWICKTYLTVIRGTPVVVQLMIIYYVILAAVDNTILVASIAFGFNSAAYVAEIIRSGIQSIDWGQMEAGRSLGFGYIQTMRYIIIPQALKNVLPALANEFIVLLKETSVSGMVTIQDLTRGGDIIRGATYETAMPLLAVAGIYLVVVMFFTYLVGRLERRLKNREH